MMTPKRLALKLSGMARRGSTQPDVAAALTEAATMIRSLESEKNYAVRLLKKLANRHGECDGCAHNTGRKGECGIACDVWENNHWEWCGDRDRKNKQ